MKAQAKILVIDDEPIVCESFKRILASHGYHVDTMQSPLEGLDLATSRKYNLVFLDLKMDQMDGMELFHKIRQKEPDLPVVVVTGYPSLSTATESIRLHASDYLLKPFTPDEILKVTRMLTLESKLHEKVVEKKLSGQSTTSEWKPAMEPILFYETAWLQQGMDGTFRVGVQLPTFITRFTTDLNLPAVNDTLYQGLPMASASIVDQSKIILPSPVSGKIIDVNDDMEKNPYLIEKNSINNCWIARIAPSDPIREVKKLQTREIVLLSKGAHEKGGIRDKLASMGYIVNSTTSLYSAIKKLKENNDKVILINASSFNSEASSLIQCLNEKIPDISVVIIGKPDSVLEETLRKNKILYYCICTLFNKEIADILYSTFIAGKRDPCTRISTSPRMIKQSIKKITVSDKHGRKISLVIFGNLLTNHNGIGFILLDKFKKNACAVQLTPGINRFSPDDVTGRYLIKEEIEKNDVLIAFQALDMGKITGQINKAIEIKKNANGSIVTVAHISVQANKVGKDVKMAFNYQTTRAIAELLFDEMTSFNYGQ